MLSNLFHKSRASHASPKSESGGPESAAESKDGICQLLPDTEGDLVTSRSSFERAWAVLQGQITPGPHPNRPTPVEARKALENSTAARDISGMRAALDCQAATSPRDMLDTSADAMLPVLTQAMSLQEAHEVLTTYGAHPLIGLINHGKAREFNSHCKQLAEVDALAMVVNSHGAWLFRAAVAESNPDFLRAILDHYPREHFQDLIVAAGPDTFSKVLKNAPGNRILRGFLTSVLCADTDAKRRCVRQLLNNKKSVPAVINAMADPKLRSLLQTAKDQVGID